MAEQTENDLEIHDEAMKRFEQVEDKEQRALAIEDMYFTHVEGSQWDDNFGKKRANRPKFTINRVAGAVAQVVGDQRQNRTAIKVRPVSGGADEKTAEVFNGIIRNIESSSKAENSYDAAFDESVTGGYGGWRVLTEFADDDVFEQDILIAPINSAASSLYFGPSDTYDKRDSDYAFVVTAMPQSEFEEKWPDAQVSSFEQLTSNSINNNNQRCREWFGEDLIRVAEYWKKEPVTKNIALLSDGRVIDAEEEKDSLDELAAQGITIIKERKVKSHKIVMYVMSGSEILEDKKEWAGKFIPLIPVYGKIHNIEGRTYIKGMTRDAKDPQRILNYETSQAVETSALTPKDPYWHTPEMSAGHESEWASFPSKNTPFMKFNADPDFPGAPQRTGAPSVQQNSLAIVDRAAADVEATTGIYAASLGNAPQLLSEKSIIAQAEKGDRGSFIYVDNLNKSIQYTGEILVDLIPRIYDTERQVRILKIDGSSELVGINLNQTIIDDQTGEENLVNDLSVGKYDVVTDTGPSFATKRVESARQLIELASSSPQIQEIALDMIVSNMDINNSEELTKRVRKGMIQAGTVEPTEDEIKELGLDQPQAPDPTQVALLENIQMETQSLMANIENKEADTANKKVTAQQNTAKTLDTLVQTMIDKAKAGIPLTNDEVQLVIAQRDIVANGQDILDSEMSLSGQTLNNAIQ